MVNLVAKSYRNHKDYEVLCRAIYVDITVVLWIYVNIVATCSSFALLRPSSLHNLYSRSGDKDVILNAYTEQRIIYADQLQ